MAAFLDAGGLSAVWARVKEQLEAAGGVKRVQVDFTAADWSGGTISIPKSRHGLSGPAITGEARMLVGGVLTAGTWAALGTTITVDPGTLEVTVHSADAYAGCVILTG